MLVLEGVNEVFVIKQGLEWIHGAQFS
jgi:hypothetical protein